MSVALVASPTGSTVVREACARDNDGLLALDAACGMGGGRRGGGGPTWTIRHQPDFFALFRVAGVRATVGIAEDDERRVVGVVTMIEQPGMDDDATASWYVSGWQVHPAHRGRTVGPALVRWAIERIELVGGARASGWFMSGGSGAALRALISRAAPSLRLSLPNQLRSYRLPTAHWRALVPARGLGVRPAMATDVEEMADLWRRAAAARRFAPRLGAASIDRWRTTVLNAPPATYWVAHTPLGAVRGFVGVWNQQPVKQFYLERDERPTGARRLMIRNRAVPLRTLAYTHWCVPGDVPRVHHALLGRTARAAWVAGFRTISLMADPRDPLADACDAWSAPFQPFTASLAFASPADPVSAREDLPLYLDVGLA